MSEMLYSGPPDAEPEPPPPPSRWPRLSVVICVAMIPLGLAGWIFAFMIGMGPRGSADYPEILVGLASFMFLAGLPISALGFLGLIGIAILDRFR